MRDEERYQTYGSSQGTGNVSKLAFYTWIVGTIAATIYLLWQIQDMSVAHEKEVKVLHEAIALTIKECGETCDEQMRPLLNCDARADDSHTLYRKSIELLHTCRRRNVVYQGAINEVTGHMNAAELREVYLRINEDYNE